MPERDTYTEIGFISREPVLAKILASRKPIILGEEGYMWIVDWIATIGSIIRSRENIAGMIVGTIDSLALQAFLSLLSVTALGEVIARLLGGTK